MGHGLWGDKYKNTFITYQQSRDCQTVVNIVFYKKENPGVETGGGADARLFYFVEKIPRKNAPMK